MFSELNLTQDWHFWGWSRMRGPKRVIPKICHMYPTMNQTWHSYILLKKIQKIYESHDTPLEFC